MIKRYLSTAILVAVIGSFGAAGTAHANPSYFATGSTTAAATTSPTYLTPGVSTSTTAVYDAYAPTTNLYQSKADYVGLLLRFHASSTATVLNASVEYSQDNIDWYRNFVIDPIQMGTTTTPNALATPFSLSWRFASSTVGGIAVPANTSTSTAAVLIPTPFRYSRVVFSVTGGIGAVWAQLVPIKEQR